MKKPSLSIRRPSGFALIATILLMVLLAIITVGTLSLSVVTLRSGSQGAAYARAQANARMALLIAIGELQRHTGSDTRVTASASIVDENYPQVMGVWKSWQGTDHEVTGRDPAPVAPGRAKIPEYSAKGVTESPSGTGRFVNWLVSTAASKTTPNINDAPSLVQTSTGTDTIPLLAGGSLEATDTRQIHVIPTHLDENGDDVDDGRLAWWVSGENQKALLAQPYAPRSNDAEGYTELGQSHTVTNPEVFGLTSLLNDRETYTPGTAAAKPASKAVSRQTMALIEPNNSTKPQKKFHDLSAYSIGLLTNTATGGWRKDLSLLTEKWDSIYSSYPGGKLPLFRLTPDAGATTLVPKPVKPASTIAVTNTAALAAATPSGSNLYPWSDYSLILGYTQPGTYYAASASWASLQSFATSYKNFSNYSGVVKSDFIWDKIAKTSAPSIKALEVYNHKHIQRIHPQIARFQCLVYAAAVEDPARLNQNPKRYQLKLMYVPFFTLWNPYNITLEHTISGTLNAGQGSGKHTNFLGLGMRRSLPGVMAIVNKATYPNPDMVPSNQYKLLTNGNFQTLDWPNNYANPYDNQLTGNVAKYGSTGIWKDLRSWGLWLPEGTLTFKPGEAKIFSPEWIDNGYGYGGGAFRMKEGYSPTNIVGRDFTSSSNLLATQSFWFLFRNDRLTQPYRDRAPGNGFSLSLGDGGSHFGGTAILPSGIGDEFHNITALATGSEGDKYWPPDEIDEVGYTVGELASGPWIPIFSMSFGPRMSIGTGPGTAQNRPTKGAVQNNALAAMVLSEPESGKAKDHPANNTFDFAYHSLSIGSTITPNLSNSAGYIATGYQSGDGLSRLIVDDIPLRPMASLIELQGWNPRGNNPYPPFQMNLIGNSDATPLISSNKVVPTNLSPSGGNYNLQHDDAYCANHLLFDDWFLSSIAPQPETSKDINTVYREFFKTENRLTNRSYFPVSADSKITDTEVTKRINSHDEWLKVASRLEVEGMFNVNSISVEAWKALLGHAKSIDRIAMHGATEITTKPVSNKHIVTRGAVATDVEAGTGAGFSGQFGNASEYTGYRCLNDEQINDLAEKIVAQVRLRGPFLSLSEFINRQLTNNKDLALAGTIQTAINNLSNDPMAKLRDPANSLSAKTMLTSDPKLAGVNYEFPDSALGASAYGAPSWIRQADILRPIAPIISTRDDTFTIRAYGDSLDKDGKVIAQAWCEAVVKRSSDFIDNSDSADSINPPVNAMNITFGRHYDIISFRWLNSDEV
jgi:type II secretory pathway pseudopilin PulG